jgi:hypothetical protein
MSDERADISGEVVIQIRAVEGAVVPEGATEDFIRASAEKLREVAQVVKTSWQNLVSELTLMQNAPSEIALEFGVDVGAEASVPFISKGSLGANFKISIKWTPKQGS